MGMARTAEGEREHNLREMVAREETERYLLDLLSALVRIPTVVPPGEHYGEIVESLIPVVAAMGFEAERIEMPEELFNARQQTGDLRGERANLLATKEYRAAESVDFYTHLDVVPAGEGWTTPPFEPVVANGRIYGRGVADSKGSVAALLTALQLMHDHDLASRYTVRVALTTDEEIGLYSGLCYFADEGLLQGDYLLCMDVDSEGVCVASNGMMTWELTVQGRSCHSSLPFLGVNAVEHAALVIQELTAQLQKKLEPRQSQIPCSPEITKLTGQTRIKPVFNVTMIQGGVKENLIPPSCVVKGDRRYIPEEAVDEVVAELEDAVEAIRRRHGIAVELQPKPGFPPMFTDPDHEWVRRVQRAATEAFGVPKGITGIQGGLDVGYVAQRTNQPVCAFGVGSSTESNAHGPNENVRISDLKQYVLFLLQLLTEHAYP